MSTRVGLSGIKYDDIITYQFKATLGKTFLHEREKALDWINDNDIDCLFSGDSIYFSNDQDRTLFLLWWEPSNFG